MRIGALRCVLDRHARVKIFLALDDRCLCGYASREASTERGLVVKVGASVQVDFATMTMKVSQFLTGSFVLSDVSKVTRRIRTHRHHLIGRVVPEQYFVLARAL